MGQTTLWISLILFALWFLRAQIESICASIAARVQRGDDLETPWLILHSPKRIQQTEPLGITAEGPAGSTTAPDIDKLLREKKYPDNVIEDIYLVHSAAVVVPRVRGHRGVYRVRVWVEAYDEALLKDITRVTYRLYNDEFPRSVISTQARQDSFELWLNVYGEFTIVACIERETGRAAWVTRYLDLPGRPPD